MNQKNIIPIGALVLSVLFFACNGSEKKSEVQQKTMAYYLKNGEVFEVRSSQNCTPFVSVKIDSLKDVSALCYTNKTLYYSVQEEAKLKVFKLSASQKAPEYLTTVKSKNKPIFGSYEDHFGRMYINKDGELTVECETSPETSGHIGRICIDLEKKSSSYFNIFSNFPEGKREEQYWNNAKDIIKFNSRKRELFKGNRQLTCAGGYAIVYGSKADQAKQGIAYSLSPQGNKLLYFVPLSFGGDFVTGNSCIVNIDGTEERRISESFLKKYFWQGDVLFFINSKQQFRSVGEGVNNVTHITDGVVDFALVESVI